MIAIFRMSIPTVCSFSATPARQIAGSGSDEARCLDEAFQRDVRPRADMADDFGGAQAADLAANGERQVAGQAEQEACGIEVARSGRVDDPRYRGRAHPVYAVAGHDYAARLAAGQGRDRDMTAHRIRRLGEFLGLVKRTDLGLVGEQDIDLALDQLAKGG